MAAQAAAAGGVLLPVCVAGQIIDPFPPVSTAVETATGEEKGAAIMYFRRTDASHGKRKAEAYNKAQKTAASIHKRPNFAAQGIVQCCRGTYDHRRVLRAVHFWAGHPRRRGSRPPPPPFLILPWGLVSPRSY